MSGHRPRHNTPTPPYVTTPLAIALLICTWWTAIILATR